jgi:CHAD domain-containing protein
VSRARRQWDERTSAAVNAQWRLPRMMSEYFADVRAALADEHSPAALHRVRLASKKLRYTLELFRQCYGAAGFDARLKSLKDLQTSLGDVNDAVTTWRLLAKVMPHSPRRQALREYLKKRAAENAEEFRAHWTEKFDADGQERWWTDFLGGRYGAKDGAHEEAHDGAAVHSDRAGRRPSRKAGA